MRIYRGKLLCDGCGSEIAIPARITMGDFNLWLIDQKNNHVACLELPQDYFDRNRKYKKIIRSIMKKFEEAIAIRDALAASGLIDPAWYPIEELAKLPPRKQLNETVVKRRQQAKRSRALNRKSAALGRRKHNGVGGISSKILRPGKAHGKRA